MTNAKQPELPTEVAQTFETFTDTEGRNAYIVALRDAKWTLQAIADATSLSRERIRQVYNNADEHTRELASTIGVPSAPPKKKDIPKQPRTFVEPSPETLARLLELQPLAEKVRSNSENYREEAEEYTRLVNHAHTVEKVPLYRLAKALGRTHGALRFRLARYGYKAPITGTSRAYKPITEENRYKSTNTPE